MTTMENEQIFECKLSLSLTDPVSTMLALKPDMDEEFGINSKLSVTDGKLEVLIKSNNIKCLMKSTSFVLERIKLSEDTVKFAKENDCN